MPLNLPPFANAEDVMSTLLSQLDGVKVVKGTADKITPPVLLVRSLGGHSDYITDFPEIQVSAFGATRSEATELALRAQALVENSFNSFVDLSNGTRVQIDGTATQTAAHPEVYDNNDLREVPAVYFMSLRRPRTYYAIP